MQRDGEIRTQPHFSIVAFKIFSQGLQIWKYSEIYQFDIKYRLNRSLPSFCKGIHFLVLDMRGVILIFTFLRTTVTHVCGNEA